MKVLRLTLKFYQRHGTINYKAREEEYEIEGAEYEDVVEYDEDGEKRIDSRVLLALLSIADITPEEYDEYDYVTVDTKEMKR